MEKGPICIGPLDLFLLLALRVSLITVLASSLGMLLSGCQVFFGLGVVNRKQDRGSPIW